MGAGLDVYGSKRLSFKGNARAARDTSIGKVSSVIHRIGIPCVDHAMRRTYPLTKPLFRIDSRKVRSVVIAESPCAAPDTSFKERCSIGAFSYIGLNSVVMATDIGRYCSIAPGANIGPSEHNITNLSTHPFASGSFGPFHRSEEFIAVQTSIKRPPAARPRTRIENDVWIGANVIVRKGVKIGTGAVIAAGSVVTKDVQPYEIVGGVPAKHIRFRFSPETIARIIKVAWWEYDLRGLAGKVIDYGDVDGALDLIEKSIKDGSLLINNPLRRSISNPDKRLARRAAILDRLTNSEMSD